MGAFLMMAGLGATHAAEKFFGPIRASAVEAISLFVIDALHFVSGIMRVQSSRAQAPSLYFLPN
jgi:hypothetical protein